MSKNINFSLNPELIKSFLKGLARKLQKYTVEIFAVFVLAAYGFLVFQINSLSNIAPDQEKVLEEQQIIKRPQIDEETVKKIEQLEDQNIAVQSLFKAARDNPFKD